MPNPFDRDVQSHMILPMAPFSLTPIFTMKEPAVRRHTSLAELFVAGIMPLVLGGGSAGLGAVVDEVGERAAQADTVCPPHTPPRGPDVIVGTLSGVTNFDSIDGIEAFSVGTTSCNVGDDEISWSAFDNQHPVIAQNIFQLKDGRFQQVGMSWIKHGFIVSELDACCSNCVPSGSNQRLGIGCADTYRSELNGTQSLMGPRSDVNPYTGEFDFPFTGRNQTGDAIFKRLQVKIADLDPARDGGGLYFAEAHYITPDESASGNQNNNASYREIEITGSGTDWSADFSSSSSTQREEVGIRAWQDHDAEVVETDIQIADEGLFILAAKTTALGNGMWHYEYALQNLNSDRSAGAFSVPVPMTASVQNVGFHDVDYHSGEIYDGTDWAGQLSTGSLTWSTASFDVDPNANALRWGTLYNFRFDSDSPPGEGEVTIGLFKPGTPVGVTAATIVPSGPPPVCSNDIVEPGEECEPPDTATCDSACQRIPVCGDGFVDGDEECDPPDATACDATCQFFGDCGGADACNDGNACTEDACEAGECVQANNSDACDDGDECTGNDTCTNGICLGGAPPSCTDATCDDCNNNQIRDDCEDLEDSDEDGVPDVCAGDGATISETCGGCGMGMASASAIMLLGLAWMRGRFGASRARN